jgi:hypothetical protein
MRERERERERERGMPTEIERWCTYIGEKARDSSSGKDLVNRFWL